MSCGKNHAYDTYQTAADGVKLAVIEALNIDEETDTLKELWSTYLKLRSIADNSAQHSSTSPLFGYDGFHSPLGGDVTFTVGSGTTETYNIDIDTSTLNVGLATDIMTGIDLEDLSEGLSAGDSISFE